MGAWSAYLDVPVVHPELRCSQGNYQIVGSGVLGEAASPPGNHPLASGKGRKREGKGVRNKDRVQFSGQCCLLVVDGGLPRLMPFYHFQNQVLDPASHCFSC